MSADNGFILRQNDEGKYVLQMYCASVDDYPPINAERALVFDTLEEAVLKYQEYANDENFIIEYGLSVQIKPRQKETKMIETKKYARKPFFVDAVQVKEDNLEEVAEWAQGEVREEAPDKTKYVHVRVHRPLNERQTKAYIGDWILYAGTGYKVYTDKAFEANFEQISTVTNSKVPEVVN